MRAVLQRVDHAEVAVDGNPVARIGRGVLALVAIARDDETADLEWMARKIVELRIFDDAGGKLNLSVIDVGGEVLLVSQFTLYGDCGKGRRPSYSDSASPDLARRLFEQFVELVRRYVPGAATGEFQAMMDVSLTNSGPVTLILDSPRKQAAGKTASLEVE